MHRPRFDEVEKAAERAIVLEGFARVRCDGAPTSTGGQRSQGHSRIV